MKQGLYQPANGAEAADFFDRFCSRCGNWDEDGGCDIQYKAEVLKPMDRGYPTEWCYKDGKPTCIAFVKIEED